MPKLPLVGNVPKGWMIAVGGGSVLVLGYVYYKHRQNAASSSTAAAATSPDPNAIDPATGMTYAEEEQLASAGQYGGYGYGATGGGFTGTTGGTGGAPTTPGPGSFVTNADWASYAELNLSGTVDPTALSAALGVYLTGRPASSAQVSLIDQAIAIAGYPPVTGSGGFPPNIKQSPGPTGGTKVTVPPVVGNDWLNAIHTLQAAGLKPSPLAKPHGAHDPITHQSPAAGQQVAAGSTVTIKGR